MRLRTFASILITTATSAFAASQAHAVDYYLNSKTGSDTNTGTQAAKAWASLQKASEHHFQPGDQLLIAAGTQYTGQLTITSSGSAGNPITISRYGQGAKPQLNGNGVTPATVFVRNAEHLIISQLQITNKGDQPQANRSGVRLELENFGTAHNITLSHLDISHINGGIKRFAGLQAGICYYNKFGEKRSRFNGLLIEHCNIQNVDRDGIKGRSDYWKRTIWYPNLNVVIRNNRIDDVAGDGIVPYGCDGALVEYNTVTNARQRTEEHAVGIWPWSSDNTTIQYNEVAYTKGIKDGQGFDCDYNCRNTLIQYNYSHHNDGGFVLVCNGKMSPLISVGNLGSTIRYNVSYNDGHPETENNRGPTFVFSGSSSNTKIYNNLIYLDKPVERRMVNVYSSPTIGAADNVIFANNVFYVAPGAQVIYVTESLTHGLFTNNVYYGELKNQPVDDAAIISSDIPELFKQQTPTFDWLRGNVNIPADWQGKGVTGLTQPATDLAGNAITANQPIHIGPWQSSLNGAAK